MTCVFYFFFSVKVVFCLAGSIAFRKAVEGTAVIASGGLVAFYGLTQLTGHREKTGPTLVELVNVAFLDELPSRQAQLTALHNTQEFDVLIRDDFSSGTSSRSTKLIHGGVRYLQKAIVKLDCEQVNIVYFPFNCTFSTVCERWWQLPYHWAGIKMYDLVAGLFPVLKRDKLLGAIVYSDGQHDDAPMNLPIALTAARYRAAIANYTEVVHLLKRADPQMGTERVCGVRCRDVITGQEFDVRAKCVINATGPFTDALRKMDDQKNPNIYQPSAGVHIVIPGYYSPDNMGLLDPATSTGRVIFFLQWEKITIGGTTDSTSAPMSKMLFIMHRSHFAPALQMLRRGDVLAAWSGIFPLVTDPNSKDTQSICRNHKLHNHIVHISDSGLVNMAGGNWTTYRSMVEETLEAAVKAHNLSAGPNWSPTMYSRLVQDYGMKVEASTYGGRAYEVAEMAHVTGKGWPFVRKHLVSKFPYIEIEILHS
uniref:glycerol-3-phosphate dehydrogenase n=1 Tax=Salmo trutta TaxID=8032 RepID=A0A674EU65_SALTR